MKNPMIRITPLLAAALCLLCANLIAQTPPLAADTSAPAYRYTMQIRAIRSTYLDGRHRDDGRKLDRGRERLMKIDDPAAIAHAVQLLADGNVPTRLLLVDWLARFDDPAATDHLLHMAMHDEDDDVHARAAQALTDRRSPELIDRLIAGLRADDDRVVRNSAGVLGLFRERRAAGPLVAALITRRTITFGLPAGWVANVTQQAYVSGLNAVVAEGVGQVEPIISTLNTGTVLDISEGFGTIVTETITIYRTEVQDALINITGQNFGFDQGRWQTWLASNPFPVSPTLPPLAPLPGLP